MENRPKAITEETMAQNFPKTDERNQISSHIWYLKLINKSIKTEKASNLIKECELVAHQKVYQNVYKSMEIHSTNNH